MSVDRCLDCFHVLGIVNRAVVNMGVHVRFQIIALSECTPRKGSAGSHGSSIKIHSL